MYAYRLYIIYPKQMQFWPGLYIIYPKQMQFWPGLYIIYPKQMQFWPRHYIPPLVTYKDTQQFVFGIKEKLN